VKRLNRKCSLGRRIAAEFLGTAFLVAAVLGSGIMAEGLAGGNVAIALLANTLATAAALIALILTFRPISGAHFNPVVTMGEALLGAIGPKEAALYVAAQIIGGIAGTACAHVMFALPVLMTSTRLRTGSPQWFSEFIATYGLILVILACSRLEPEWLPLAVGCYIAAAYWFTASTSFANPAVTIARSLSDTFSGIRPTDVPLFIVAQIGGACGAVLTFRWLYAGLTDGLPDPKT
jgi:glycerol uptake facilitator-like aquaporin